MKNEYYFIDNFPRLASWVDRERWLYYAWKLGLIK